MTEQHRMAAIKAAIAPYATAANFEIEDVMQAAERSVPGVDPIEVAEAFDELAAEAFAERDALHAELRRRGHDI